MKTELEKSPLQSKKFVAFLVAEITWKLIILVCVLKLIQEGEGSNPLLLHWTMLTAVIIAGFIEAGFIGGQAWLDKYVRIAQMSHEGAVKLAKLTKIASKEDDS